MQRCIECGNSVNDTDKVCTACRLAEWRHFQAEEEAKRLKREALESHRDAYLGRKKAVRDSIRAGVVTAVSLMLFLAFLSATCDAMKYEWQTKPAALKAQGVK
jgi:predicted  nucleic acid-binding Zn-ribbon protein